MRLPTKPRQTPTSTGILPILRAKRHRGGDHVLRRLLAAHRLEQLHHVGRAEEVQADHVLGALGHRGDLVDVERRGVGGEDRARLADRVELAEDVLLELHVLEHRLDHDVLVGEGALVERAGEQAIRVLDVLGLDAARLRRALVVLAHHGEALVERGPDRASTTVTGMPALAKFMAMPPPMVPQPSTPHASRSCAAACRPARRGPSPLRARRRSSSAAQPTACRSPARGRARLPWRGPRRTAASTAASMQRMLYSGAWKPRVLRAILRRNSAKSPGFFFASSIFSLRSRIFWSGRFSASTFFANATALATRSPSRDLVDQAVGERFVAADRIADRRIISSAFGTPTTRGSRWVPPAPGSRPIFTSGWPYCALGSPTR